jgi:hypothetical protein
LGRRLSLDKPKVVRHYLVYIFINSLGDSALARRVPFLIQTIDRARSKMCGYHLPS